MLKLIGKGKNAILGAQTVLNWTYGQVYCNYNLAILLVRPTPPTFGGPVHDIKDQPNILQHQELTVSSVSSVWGVTLEEIQAKYVFHPTATTFTTTIL